MYQEEYHHVDKTFTCGECGEQDSIIECVYNRSVPVCTLCRPTWKRTKTWENRRNAIREVSRRLAKARGYVCEECGIMLYADNGNPLVWPRPPKGSKLEELTNNPEAYRVVCEPCFYKLRREP